MSFRARDPSSTRPHRCDVPSDSCFALATCASPAPWRPRSETSSTPATSTGGVSPLAAQAPRTSGRVSESWRRRWGTGTPPGRCVLFLVPLSRFQDKTFQLLVASETQCSKWVELYGEGPSPTFFSFLFFSFSIRACCRWHVSFRRPLRLPPPHARNPHAYHHTPLAPPCRQIFARGIRESTEDVSFLCHSLGSLELAAERLEQARAVFVAGLERFARTSCLESLHKHCRTSAVGVWIL